MTIWRKGMLAVCVDDEPRWHSKGGCRAIVKDGVYQVTATCRGVATGELCLRLADLPHHYCANRFRPAVQDDQRCEEDFITLLKRSIPQPTGGDTLSVPAADCMGTLSHTLHAVGPNSNRDCFISHRSEA